MARPPPFFHTDTASFLPPVDWIERSAVVVVGAGIAANSAAYHLAAEGCEVAVLLPGPDLDEPSSHGLGILLPSIGEDPARLARALGPKISLELFTMCHQAVRMCSELDSSLHFGFQKSSGMTLARDLRQARDLEASAELLEDAGLPARILTGDALAEVSGPGFLLGLEWFDAGLIDPAAMKLELARAAQARGAVYQPSTQVEAIEESSEGLLLKTSRGQIQAELVIHADGFMSARICPFLRDCLLMARVQFLATEPFEGGPRAPSTASLGFDYWRRGPSNELLLGGFRYLSYELGLTYAEHGLDERVSQAQERAVEALCGKNLPIKQRWTRFIDVGCDNLPMVGAVPGQARQHVLVGFGGLDSTIGALMARELVRALLERPSDVELPPLFALRRML